MGLFSNKIRRDELKKGDHIYIWRLAYAYSNHGDFSAFYTSFSGGLLMHIPIMVIFLPFIHLSPILILLTFYKQCMVYGYLSSCL
jgi:hypothetical protein